MADHIIPSRPAAFVRPSVVVKSDPVDTDEQQTATPGTITVQTTAKPLLISRPQSERPMRPINFPSFIPPRPISISIPSSGFELGYGIDFQTGPYAYAGPFGRPLIRPWVPAFGGLGMNARPLPPYQFPGYFRPPFERFPPFGFRPYGPPPPGAHVTGYYSGHDYQGFWKS